MRMLQVQSNNMSLGALASTLGESSHWPRALQQLKVQTPKEPNLSIECIQGRFRNLGKAFQTDGGVADAITWSAVLAGCARDPAFSDR